ncbi:hypothetical protein [Paracoccus sp. IB05]|uniref:hypothetical protein n=1 Tax=Paracoccus sp. IB05 TaxID=2779367 RepID=UPI0018E83D26|nr:hypothetical protein [Paracoccus sp. IB05]
MRQLWKLLVNEPLAASDLLHRIAIHECGHTIVGQSLGYQILRVMLTRDGGRTRQAAPEHPGCLSDIEAEITMLMAGRTSEKIVFGDVCGGSGGPDISDLAKETNLANRYEAGPWGTGPRLDRYLARCGDKGPGGKRAGQTTA